MLEVQNGKFSIKTIKNDYPQFKYREEDEKLLSELVSKSIELFPKDLILHPCFVLHGGIHAMGVASNLNTIIEKSKIGINVKENLCLMCGAWLHDIGMLPRKDDPDELSPEQIREVHHIRSEKWTNDFFGENKTYSNYDVEFKCIGKICKGHRKENLNTVEYKPRQVDRWKIRTRFLAALLRVADELDLNRKRAPTELREIFVKKKCDPYSRLHWLKHYYVTGIQFAEDPMTKKRRIVAHIFLELPDNDHIDRLVGRHVEGPILKEVADHSLQNILALNGEGLEIGIQTHTDVNRDRESLDSESWRWLNEYEFYEDLPRCSMSFNSLAREIEDAYSKEDFDQVCRIAASYVGLAGEALSLNKQIGGSFAYKPNPLEKFDEVRRYIPKLTQNKAVFLLSLYDISENEVTRNDANIAICMLRDYAKWFVEKNCMAHWNYSNSALTRASQLLTRRDLEGCIDSMLGCLEKLMLSKCMETTGILLDEDDILRPNHPFFVEGYILLIEKYDPTIQKIVQLHGNLKTLDHTKMDIYKLQNDLKEIHNFANKLKPKYMKILRGKLTDE